MTKRDGLFRNAGGRIENGLAASGCAGDVGDFELRLL